MSLGLEPRLIVMELNFNPLMCNARDGMAPQLLRIQQSDLVYFSDLGPHHCHQEEGHSRHHMCKCGRTWPVRKAKVEV